LKSVDRGDTWTLADGSPIDLPVTPESKAVFKQAEQGLTTYNVACDSKNRPWISLRSPDGIELYHHDGKKWISIQPAQRLSTKIDLTKLTGYASMTVDSKDRIYVMATLAGNVVVLYSFDMGRTFRLLHAFPKDKRENFPHRGLNIERPTGHHHVDVPWLLFCSGEKGPDCFGKGILNITRAVQLFYRPAKPELRR
jgi:hypothetical protein